MTTIAIFAQGGSGWMGGLQYTAHLIEAVSRLPAAERGRVKLLLLASEQQRDGLGQTLTLADGLVESDRPPSLMERLGDQWRRRVRGQSNPWIDRMLDRQQIEFVYPYHAQDHRPRRYRCAAWLPDFQHVHMPEMFSSQELDERRLRFANVAEFAQAVVLSSEDARRDFARDHAAAAARARVLPFPSCPKPEWYKGDPRAVVSSYHLPEHFLLVCNQFWKHKNHEQLWDALVLLGERGIRPAVVLTGHTHDYRNPGHFDQLLASAQRAGLGDQLRFLGVVPRADQIQLMRASVAMLQPSRFEGWSTVVEDARALGVPIVLSDIAVHLEQAPSPAGYFALDDAAAMADQIERFWANRGQPHDEAAAREDNQSRVHQFARRFIDLAEDRW